MPHKPTGTIYKSRGVGYAAVTVDKNHRESIALPAGKTEAQAEAHKTLVNAIAQRLRAVGKASMALKFIEEAGKRPQGKDLDRLLSAVDAVCRGAAVPKDIVLVGATIKDIGKSQASRTLDNAAFADTLAVSTPSKQRWQNRPRTTTTAGRSDLVTVHLVMGRGRFQDIACVHEAGAIPSPFAPPLVEGAAS